MKKVIYIFIHVFLLLSMTACTNLNNIKANTDGDAQWDFDHHVQFTQTQLAKNYYQLEIIPNNKIDFSQQATFLLRQSYSLCLHYHYTLEIIQGIEGFDDKRAMPNYIFPSLIAKITCNQK